MAFRRKKTEVQEVRHWKNFLELNQPLFTKSGLSAWVVSSEAHWLDFLGHGYLDHHEDPTNSSVEELNAGQYGYFKALVEEYFKAGFPSLSVSALRPKDRQDFEKRFPPVYVRFAGGRNAKG